MSRRWTIFIFAILLGHFLACSASTPVSPPSPPQAPPAAPAEVEVPAEVTNPFAGDPAAVTMGEVIFNAQCATQCHQKETGWKGGKYPYLFDCEWRHGGSDREVFLTLTQGIPETEMLGWKGKLSDESLWKVIAYLRAASQCQAESTAGSATP